MDLFPKVDESETQFYQVNRQKYNINLQTYNIKVTGICVNSHFFLIGINVTDMWRYFRATSIKYCPMASLKSLFNKGLKKFLELSLVEFLPKAKLFCPNMGLLLFKSDITERFVLIRLFYPSRSFLKENDSRIETDVH